MENKVFAKSYELQKKVGNGAFGEIWVATNSKSSQQFAIKFEDSKSKHQQLYFECKIYQHLHSETSILDHSFPQVIFFGSEQGKNFMIMELLGSSLEELFNRCDRRFSLKTVLMIADQMISRVEYVHSRRIIHRDIKPDNFAVGLGKNAHKVYLFDFGLAKKYMSSHNEHIKYKDGKGLTGTARYASINTHLGIEQSRRDDLEAIIYVLIYFLSGSLPWQNLRAKNVKEKYEKIRDKKIQTKTEELCEGLPREFAIALSYIRELKFTEKPDYAYLRSLFKNLFKQSKFIYDFEYDWIVRYRQQLKKQQAATHLN